MKLARIFSLAMLLAAGTVFTVAAQDTTTTVKTVKHHKAASDSTWHKTKKTTHVHKKTTKDSTVTKP